VPRRLSALLALLAALALLACGEQPLPVPMLPTGQLTQAQYEDAFPKAAQGLAARHGVGEPLDEDASATEQAEHVAGLQAVLREWAARLASLRPPVAAAAAQARYVAGIRGFADDLDRARTALEAGDVKDANALLSSGRIVSAHTRADLVAARRAFHALGYDLEDLDKAPVETD
jgi:predicted GNAT family acetyltransferase